jgi:hypothetical protein
MSDFELVAGRCGACTKFQKDFGTGAKTYGHCGVKPRAGSISVTNFKCDVYVPRPEVAPPPPVAAPRRESERGGVRDPFAMTAELPRRQPSRDAPRPSRSPRAESPTAGFRSRLEERARHDQDPVDGLFEEETMNRAELRDLIREAIEDSLGIGEVELIDRFKGGSVVIRPGTPGTADRELSIDALLHKVVMIRDNLRVLEQKVNQHDKLDDADRIALQQYITRCYGSLTSFNMLFKNRDDWFKGASTKDD